MTERSVTHATFAIERIYGAPPARVFAAWASAEAKSHEEGTKDLLDILGRALEREASVH